MQRRYAVASAAAKDVPLAAMTDRSSAAQGPPVQTEGQFVQADDHQLNIVSNDAASIRLASIMEGVDQAAQAALGIANLRHRSALLKIPDQDPSILADAIYSTIGANYVRGRGSANKDRSSENWRWQYLQTQISPHNSSPEVVVERAIAAACHRLDRDDWANQVPVASGLTGGKRDRRRAIDLVRRRGPHHFEFIELKISSDTPLYAAMEIIGYGCLWLIARDDRPSRPSALLDADHVDLRVLAPSEYYHSSTLMHLEASLDVGVRALGQRHGTVLTFAFDVLDQRIRPDTIPNDRSLLAYLDCRASATARGAA